MKLFVEYAETYCGGLGCTPDGCGGHATTWPISLIVDYEGTSFDLVCREADDGGFYKMKEPATKETSVELTAFKELMESDQETNKKWPKAMIALVAMSERDEKIPLLAARWRKDAEAYQKQVDEARRVGTPHAQMLSAATFLRQCAKDLEALL